MRLIKYVADIVCLQGQSKAKKHSKLCHHDYFQNTQPIQTQLGQSIDLASIWDKFADQVLFWHPCVITYC